MGDMMTSILLMEDNPLTGSVFYKLIPCWMWYRCENTEVLNPRLTNGKVIGIQPR